ncbi:hypothetical protein C8E03_11438 [Lachnotalea glycerini]|uniref:Uncharacterized protein n=1 Tax=Lachnotalea glycerini TaxID=1763509 RepID=A0A255IMF3_9FIRM|nr:hypothetical protein [Lachnotalea glycerini]OYO84368.1 hypothetical protein CG709_15155 [Lachnotalea glycerini]PXV85961.1 hypothetical protein C8E03_11438 [Lachnotalea glycerini]RDY31396.1 hypothetical protein CG710_009760 [Lachnotalea glycerini]
MTREEQFQSDNLSIFLNSLDEKSRKIFWYFRCHGHARIAELTELIGSLADMEVLDRLREVINPAAIEIFGKPILEFRESGLDRMSGKKIPFHWWLSDDLSDNQLFIGEGGKPLVDVFDEENQIVIITEISSSITLSDRVKIEQRHGIVQITLSKNQ